MSNKQHNMIIEYVSDNETYIEPFESLIVKRYDENYVSWMINGRDVPEDAFNRVKQFLMQNNEIEYVRAN